MRTRLFAALAAGAVTLASIPIAQAAQPILIGMAVAQSGWMTAFDEDPSKAAAIAVDDINAAGGVLGRPLELKTIDTKTDPAQAFKAGSELLHDGASFIVASCDFDMGAPAALAAQNAGVLSMSICSGSPKWGPQGIGPLVYTISVAVQAESYLIAEWARMKQDWKSAYVLEETNYTYTRSQWAGFKERWSQLPDTTLLGVDTYKVDDPSISVQITRIKALPKKPDFIYLCSTVTALPSIIRQLHAAGIDEPLVTGMGADGTYWLQGVPHLTGLYLPVHASVYGNDPNPDVNKFVERFKQRYGRAPTSAFALMGYSVIQAYALAVKRAGTLDATKVAAQLNAFSNEPLLIGPRSFTKDIHIQTTVRGEMMEIKDGQVTPLNEYYTGSKPVPLASLFKE